MPLISSDLDATIAELDRLQQPLRTRRSEALAQLTAFVERLDVLAPAATPEPMLDDRRPGDRAPSSGRRAPDPSAVVEQARGWPNAVVREKIVDEALRVGRW